MPGGMTGPGIGNGEAISVVTMEQENDDARLGYSISKHFDPQLVFLINLKIYSGKIFRLHLVFVYCNLMIRDCIGSGPS